MSNSVGYILGFCTAVCLVCSVIVSSTAVGLKEIQEINKQLDRQKKVLTVAGLMKEGQSLSRKQVQDLFARRIKAIVVDLETGKVDPEVTKKASTFDQQKAKADPARSHVAPKNPAGVARVPNKALVYLVSKTNIKEKGFKLAAYIFPVEGKGLWSTLYGFISLAPDLNEIRGLTFYQHGETPGLGGEVDNPSWKRKWVGRLAFGPKGMHPSQRKGPRIKVKKGIAGSPKVAPYQVDGLSGATITSNGVTHLLRFWLGEHGFGPYIKNQLQGASPTKPNMRTEPAKRAEPTKRNEPAQPRSTNPAPARRAVGPAAPTPVRRAEPAPVPTRPAAPAPVRRAEPAPAKRAAAPTPARPAAPAPTRLAAPAPVRSAAPAPTRPAAPVRVAPPTSGPVAPPAPATRPAPGKR